jgi:ADP-dependent NAD(P)H-hydrate dehydratase
MPSTAEAAPVTPAMLRDWPLPSPDGGKEARGRTLVVGGSRETPGAVVLAAEAALRSGAGKLQVATAASVATAVAMALPEALVRGLRETSSGAIAADAVEQVQDLAADASSVLVGPGLSDPDQSGRLLRSLLASVRGALAVDALALAALTDDPGCLQMHGAPVVLSPNAAEAAHVLRCDEAEVADDPAAAAVAMAATTGCVVSMGGSVGFTATPEKRLWRDDSGAAGLGVSGSGDVRAGVIAGLLARGADGPQAAVWAAHLHGRAGERLASTVGRTGFLARDLPAQVPTILAEIEQ